MITTTPQAWQIPTAQAAAEVQAQRHIPDSDGDPRDTEVREAPDSEATTTPAGATTTRESVPGNREPSPSAVTPGNGEVRVDEDPGMTWSLDTLDHMFSAQGDPLYAIREDLRLRHDESTELREHIRHIEEVSE